MKNEVERATGLLVIEVVNSNPNGDPDRESEPRQRPNGRGEISPVSFKRKLRDLMEDCNSPFFENLPDKFRANPDCFRILETRGREIKEITKEMGDTTNFDEQSFLDSTFVKKYWDARVFGNTFLEKGLAKGFIKTGVVQFGVGVSISPIDIVRHTNTKKAGVQEGKSSGMAPLAFRIVQHGVYCMPFFVNPNYARKSGCTSDDIDLLKLLIPRAYELNRSAIRPDVRIRHAWLITHTNSLGSCPDHLLIDALTPTRKGNASDPSNEWLADYDDKTFLPEDLLSRVKSVVDLMTV
jgi:CRISPR-associated protein Csd2